MEYFNKEVTSNTAFNAGKNLKLNSAHPYSSSIRTPVIRESITTHSSPKPLNTMRLKSDNNLYTLDKHVSPNMNSKLTVAKALGLYDVKIPPNNNLLRSKQLTIK